MDQCRTACSLYGRTITTTLGHSTKTWFTPRYYGYICWVNQVLMHVHLCSVDGHKILVVCIHIRAMHGTEHTILKLTPSSSMMHDFLGTLRSQQLQYYNSYTGNSPLALYKQALCSCHCRLIAFTLQFASSFFYLSDEHYPERLPNCRE